MPSTINWHSHPLTRTTIISPSYKTTQNVRRFFAKELGHEVKFKSEFMLWLHASIGTSLGEAVEEYRRRYE